MRKILFTAIAVSVYSFAFADVHPAKIFADSMVLQRGMAIPVWGWADKGEKISVQFNKQIKTVITGADGKWKISLDLEKAGGPYLLSIKGKNQVVLKGVLIGDVWICSGQSNMEFTVKSSKNSDAEITAADFPMIRHIKIPNTISDKPLEDLSRNSEWHSASPAHVGGFTGVGYFFARDLYQQLHVPIGLIHTSWGGTDVETWISRQALENNDEFKELMAGLPSLNLDSIAAIRNQAMLLKIQKMQGALPTAAELKLWKDISLNDKGWLTMQLPGLWEQQSLPEFDGIVWFRKTITLSAADAGKTADIFLGMIDDNEETYINGVKIGSTNGYNVKRVYHIPAGVLHEGKNLIAFRVEDTGGGGGLYGAAADLHITIGDRNESLTGEWSYRIESSGKAGTIGPNSYPSLLYNAMINPLIPYAIKGAIWYQGENNAGRAYQYRTAFPLMIKDWRKRWKQGDFPFYFVQLASFNSGNGNREKGSNWAELREAQTMTLSLPNTGMAVTTDIGESKDIHPKNKQDVGKRLAAVALHQLYNKTNEFSGPVYQSMRAEGNKLILSFTHVGSGLTVKDASGNVEGFEVAGTDQKFYPAKASIQGNQIALSAENVKTPIAVHYAWADDAGNANLFNKEGFPANPFRTDKWKGITQAGKYTITLK